MHSIATGPLISKQIAEVKESDEMPKDARFGEAFLGLWAQLSYLNQNFGSLVTGEALAEAFVFFVAEGFKGAKGQGKEADFLGAINEGLHDAAQKVQTEEFGVSIVLGLHEKKLKPML